MELVQSAIGSGSFLCGFVLAIELVGPSQRNMATTLLMCCYSIGVILMGTYASWTTNFRTLLWICNAPSLLVLSNFWCIPESFRWLMTSERRRDAAEIIINAAKVNGVTLQEDTIQRLHDHCNGIITMDFKSTSNKPESFTRSESLFDSKELILRTVGCGLCWLVNAFVAYGLTLNSVSLGGNKYTNFILMNAVDIPSYIATYFLTTHVGRRWSLSGMLLLAGCSCLGSLFLPTIALQSNASAFRLPFFLVGKFAITSSFTVLYIYTAEIFPTGMRNGMLCSCSMIGCLGSMMAPQTPLLV